jgi:hypothetical protein
MGSPLECDSPGPILYVGLCGSLCMWVLVGGCDFPLTVTVVQEKVLLPDKHIASDHIQLHVCGCGCGCVCVSVWVCVICIQRERER